MDMETQRVHSEQMDGVYTTAQKRDICHAIPVIKAHLTFKT